MIGVSEARPLGRAKYESLKSWGRVTDLRRLALAQARASDTSYKNLLRD